MTDTNTPAAKDGGTSPAFPKGSQLIDKSLLHTAQCFINTRDGIDLFTNRNSKSDPIRVTHWHVVNNGEMVTFRLNPNHEVSVSPLSGNQTWLGDCPSLEMFGQIVSDWAVSEGYQPDDIRFSRVDFAFDNCIKENADLFKKLCVLLHVCYAVKYDVCATDQSWFETITSLQFKGCHVQTSRLPIGMNLYLKGLQDPKRGAIWRLELRYIRTPRNKSRLQDPESMLNAIITELRTLPEYYDDALANLNTWMTQKYIDLDFDPQDSISGNGFLSIYRDRLFSREQGRDFFRTLTNSEEQALVTRVNNFSNRYEPMYISKAAFKRFIDDLIVTIREFINGENMHQR